MSFLDFVLLASLMTAVALCFRFRSNRALRIFVPLVLLGTICACLFSLFAFSPRLAASSHQKKGRPWSPEFRDGVLTMAEITTPYYPYILVSSLGLALLALAPLRGTKFQPESKQ